MRMRLGFAVAATAFVVLGVHASRTLPDDISRQDFFDSRVRDDPSGQFCC